MGGRRILATNYDRLRWFSGHERYGEADFRFETRELIGNHIGFLLSHQIHAQHRDDLAKLRARIGNPATLVFLHTHEVHKTGRDLSETV